MKKWVPLTTIKMVRRGGPKKGGSVKITTPVVDNYQSGEWNADLRRGLVKCLADVLCEATTQDIHLKSVPVKLMNISHTVYYFLTVNE